MAPPTPAPVPSSDQQQQQEEEQEEPPAGPVSILESLQERREKYRLEESRAKEAGNESKARRMGRIRAQYEEAIKLHKAGRPIPRSDLPDPPGFAPIPLSDPAPPRAAPASAPAPKPAPTPAPTPAPAPGKPEEVRGGAVAGGRKGPARQSSVMSVQDKQLAGLTKRQAMFKAAALQAKQQVGGKYFENKKIFCFSRVRQTPPRST